MYLDGMLLTPRNVPTPAVEIEAKVDNYQIALQKLLWRNLSVSCDAVTSLIRVQSVCAACFGKIDDGPCGGKQVAVDIESVCLNDSVC
jgi:hypothetical protein